MKKTLSLFLILCMLFPTGTVSFASSDYLLTYNFEDITEEGWTYWGSLGENNTYPVSDAYAEGGKSLFLYDTSTTAATGICSEYFAVSAGTSYTLLTSFYTVKTKIRAYLRFYDSSGVQLQNKSIAVTPSSSWVEKEVYDTAPQNATKGRFIICTDTIDIGGGYIDGIKVVSGEVTGAGDISGTVPETLPTIEEYIEEIEIIDDGYTDGQIIFSENFDTGSSSISDWSYHNNKNSYSVVEKNATTGSYSLYVKDSSAAQSEGVIAPAFSVEQGNTYTFYADAYNYVKGQEVRFRFYDSEGAQLTQFTVSESSTRWLNLRVEGLAPVGAKSARVVFLGSVAGVGEAYYDNIRVYKGRQIIRHGEYEYSAPTQAGYVNASIVQPSNNKLVYNTYNDYGDTLSDFSYAGFYKGEVNLPDTENLPVAATLSPSGTEDDTSLIQSAIDEAAASSSDTRMKVIKLKAGTYYISETGIKLTSGIVLSGEGQGPNGTILYAKDKSNYNVIEFFGSDPQKTTSNVYISDDYVKSGSKEINVDDASYFKIGDTIRIVHPSTDDWITAMQMKDVNTVYGNTVSWVAGALNNITERTITAISGNKLTLDYGLFIPYEKQYAKSYIYAVDDSGYLSDIGIENLRFESYFNGDPFDLNHAKMAIYTKRSKNVFVRNVTAKNMYNGVFGCRVASQITVQNCSNIDPVSTVVGGNRYPFYADLHSEKILFTGCYSYDGRHDYMAVKGTSGPIVFSDSISDMSNAASETHAGFATGVLYDNIYQINDRANGSIALANRGYYGTDTPQGWTAGGCVAWNCLSNTIIANKPPLNYQNFLVGVWGIYNTPTTEEMKQAKIDDYKYYGYRTTGVDVGPDTAYATNEGTSFIGDVYKEAEFNAVNPRSLYKAQLSERFTGVITNAKPNAPVIVYPRPDKEVSLSENNVTVSGIYQIGATKVNIYIDDVKYEATLDTSTKEFSYSKTLSEGVHKIYATQTIDGVEGNKTADRFIIIGSKGTENQTYLQSNYSNDTLSLISNDTRLTYDEYIEENSHIFPMELEGEGTDASPYIIDSEEKFNYVLKKGSTAEKDKVYLLTGFDEEALTISESFKPLSVAFSGKLIGGNMENGAVVSKVQKIDLGTLTTGSTEFVTVNKTARGGLINYMEGATVKNLELYGDITVTNTTGYFGTLAGCISNSAVDNVVNRATITDGQYWATAGIIGRAKDSSSVTNCANYGSITLPEAKTTRVNVSGIVGLLESSSVSKCYNFAEVHGRDNAGGIVGSSTQSEISLCGNYGDISASKNDGTSYAGGIAGRTNGSDESVTTSFNTGSVSGANYSGSIVGQVNASKTDTVSDCFNLGVINGTDGSGLVAGKNSGTLTVSNFYDLANPELLTLAGNGTVTFANCYSIGEEDTDATSTNVSKKSYQYISDLKINDDTFADKWTIQGDFGYPVLVNNLLNVSVCNFAGLGTEESPYRILVTNDLKNVTNNPDAYYILTADIYGMDEMLCVDTAFSGVFDGNGFSVELNLDESGYEGTTETPKYVGLFSKATGTIKNLTTTGTVNVGYVDCYEGAGAIAGMGDTGSFLLENCKNYADITSTGHQVAGIAGRCHNGTITKCYNYGDVEGWKASGIVGVMTTWSSHLTNCGNYGNITADYIASGISSWIYVWNWMSNSFNVGTITAKNENGIACGLYAGMSDTTDHGLNINNSFNAGTLIGANTYGIAQINEDNENTVTIKNTYNAVGADYPVSNYHSTLRTLETEPNYYLADESQSDGGIDYTYSVDTDGLKNISIKAFDIAEESGYAYPQITENVIDSDYDDIDFCLVTVDNKTTFGTNVDVLLCDYAKFYMRKNTKLKLNIEVSDADFYYAYLNGNLVEEKENYVEISEDTVVTVSDKAIEYTLPENLSATPDVFTSNYEESITVDNVTFEKYALIASRAGSVLGLKLKEFGIYMSRYDDLSSDKYEYKVSGDKEKISPLGAFGILLFNREDGVGGMQDGVTYYILPYAVYVDYSGLEYNVIGDVKSFVLL